MGKPPAWAVRCEADNKALFEGHYWDDKKGAKICRYANTLFQSQFIDGKFQLLEWQERLLRCFYSWRMPDGAARIKTGNLHTAKKNGKTLLTAIMASFELLFSDKKSPKIMTASASKENAAQIFSEVQYALEHGLGVGSDPDFSILTHSKTVRIKSTNSELKTLASDGKRVHGYHSVLSILDECHVCPLVLYNAVNYSTVARKGQRFLISTAGTDINSWYYDVYQKSKRIMNDGDTADLRYYAEIHETDSDADLEDPKQWYKACPSLGYSYSEADFRDEMNAAKSEGVGAWLNFQQLMLNKWVKPHANAWLDMSNFGAYTKEYSDEELAHLPCYIGIDLSETICPTSVSLVFDLGDRSVYVKHKAWVCEGAKKKREGSNFAKYETFQELEITPGDMLDIELVFNYVVEVVQKYNVMRINFDPRGAYTLANRIYQELNIETNSFTQSGKNYDPVMREFERAYKEGRVYHDGSLWMQYCFSNVRISMNRYNEISPNSDKSIDHIDCAISTLVGYREIIQPEGKTLIYLGD